MITPDRAPPTQTWPGVPWHDWLDPKPKENQDLEVCYLRCGDAGGVVAAALIERRSPFAHVHAFTVAAAFRGSSTHLGTRGALAMLAFLQRKGVRFANLDASRGSADAFWRSLAFSADRPGRCKLLRALHRHEEDFGENVGIFGAEGTVPRFVALKDGGPRGGLVAFVQSVLADVATSREELCARVLAVALRALPDAVAPPSRRRSPAQSWRRMVPDHDLTITTRSMDDTLPPPPPAPAPAVEPARPLIAIGPVAGARWRLVAPWEVASLSQEERGRILPIFGGHYVLVVDYERAEPVVDAAAAAQTPAAIEALSEADAASPVPAAAAAPRATGSIVAARPEDLDDEDDALLLGGRRDDDDDESPMWSWPDALTRALEARPSARPPTDLGRLRTRLDAVAVFGHAVAEEDDPRALDFGRYAVAPDAAARAPPPAPASAPKRPRGAAASDVSVEAARLPLAPDAPRTPPAPTAPAPPPAPSARLPPSAAPTSALLRAVLARTGAATARDALNLVRYGPARTGALRVADAVPAALRRAAEAKLPDVAKVFADAKKSSDGYRLHLSQYASQVLRGSSEMTVSVESPHGRKVAFGAPLKARIEDGPRMKKRTDQIQEAGGWQGFNALAFGAACEAIADLASARRAFEEGGFSSLPRVAALLDVVEATYTTHAAHLDACQAALTSLVTDRAEHSSSSTPVFAEGGVGVLFAPAGKKGNIGKKATDYYLATAHGEGRAAAIKAAGGAASVVKYASVEEAQRAYDSEARRLGLITNAARTPLEAARLGLAVCHFHGGNRFHHVFFSAHKGLWQAGVALSAGSGREKRTKNIRSPLFADAETAAAYVNVILQAVKIHDPERPCHLNLGVGVTVDQKYALKLKATVRAFYENAPELGDDTALDRATDAAAAEALSQADAFADAAAAVDEEDEDENLADITDALPSDDEDEDEAADAGDPDGGAVPGAAQLSEYELERRERIVRNVRFLARLGFVTIPPAADADLLHPFWLQAA
jgi:hypothetical protein